MHFHSALQAVLPKLESITVFFEPHWGHSMTTPPIPPAASPEGPREPVNLWAPPTSPPARPPHQGLLYPVMIHPPSFVPPRRTSRVGPVIAICLGVLLVGALATVFYLLPEGRGTAVGDSQREVVQPPAQAVVFGGADLADVELP